MVFVAALLATGCSLLSPDACVNVIIPGPPKQWLRAFPDLSFLLVFLDANGDEQHQEVTEWQSAVSISCAKAANTPILAYPRVSWDATAADAGPGLLRPAGGLYPASLLEPPDQGSLQLSWQDGAAALVVSRLRAIGRDVSLLNAGRLMTYLRQEPDPWNLDLDAMAEKMARGEFRVYDIDSLTCRDVRIRPGVGTWFLEGPFSPALTAEDEVIALQGVSLGSHGLFSTDGRFFKLQVGAYETVLLPVQ
ncbi:MAG: hypothetical protein ABSF77_08645 [Spirochaetia bacterium]|jgi:hypothetical protein